jgi:hypothetical protein
MEFIATLQVRTPLRILRQHGQTLPLGTPLPDDFEAWMGIWVAKPKSFRELGLDVDEPRLEQVIASPAGPVTAAAYLPFLIAVREAVEDTAGGLERRMERLQRVCDRPQFARWVAAEGGAAAMRDRFFPLTLSLIPGLPRSSQAALSGLGLVTVGALRDAADSALRAVTGVGPRKLEAIREFCATCNGDPQAERVVSLAP